ncbi:MAG: tRNA (adenosine(37)-N6)-threonylcarbamoyltransferase complex transferase subunit TsaD [Parachlamydia sp.]|nr:tRNA (adenosine(37)-N6)-threonylcarbamoyltransferase complex transferase subunit TsaD [Parachlamydia sp.]
MLVLGIESTCDETGCAIVRDGKEILSNVVSSQIDLHEQYGGVVPELACRRHIDIMIPVMRQAMEEANADWSDIDLIAVAHAPGLIGALLIGLQTAKALAIALQKPFIGVNHIEAHLYAALMSHETPVAFPALGVILSGGHTSLVRMENVGRYVRIGQTADDAVGEAFDKVAKLLGLPYPGGPQVETLALKGDPDRFALRAGQVKGRPFDFSFSGLKTGVLYALKGQNGKSDTGLSEQERCDLAASFQKTALQDILRKTLEAARQQDCRSVVFGGGVTSNQALRRLFQENAGELALYWPSTGLSLDNAAMIAGLGYHLYQNRGKGDPLDLDAITRIKIN